MDVKLRIAELRDSPLGMSLRDRPTACHLAGKVDPIFLLGVDFHLLINNS